MNAFEKLAFFRQSMAFEDPEPPTRSVGNSTGTLEPCPTGGTGSEDHPCDLKYPIYMAAMPGGRRIPILKTMLTSVCERNCNYCFFRSGRDISRQTLRPEELAGAFIQMAQKGLVQGMLLSSGIAGGGSQTQDRLLATAEILRNKYDFRGYLHLKLMPGAQQAQIERAMQLASRVSVNLEAPTTLHLQRLAPMKQLVEELVKPLQWVDQIRREKPIGPGGERRWPSSTTQFVVGAAGESDMDLLRASDYLHRNLHLRRIYYSGFTPLQGTPFENLPAAHPWRRVRLYQADFLLRDYGFSFEDFPFLQDGNLPLNIDPKLAWARQNFAEQPLEINHARLDELLRVPGVGPKGAKAILAARKKGKIKNMEELRRLGLRGGRMDAFILLDGRRPSFQPELW
ncbi:MAG: helix-hairpin-helix domain-containing protein [Anaerolineaceae bacterium]|nr:helix-hairpin-helix domain-containing protein [Anaerolineaceae bacterium]